MRLRLALLSDLHIDIRRRRLIRAGATETDANAAMATVQTEVRAAAAGADLAFVLGDVCEGLAGIAWTAETFIDLPSIYVAGNHEFYRYDLRTVPRVMAQAAAATPNVRFLDNSTATLEIGGRHVRVLGSTLWTDYALYDGAPAQGSMDRAAALMYDHQRISFGEGRLFHPLDALALHRQARVWLETELARDFAGTTIVATHHAPSPQSIEPRFQGDSLSPAFGSDLEPLMLAYRMPLWLHGHTHHNVDYHVGDTRVVTHQWGYPHESPPLGVKIIEI